MTANRNRPLRLPILMGALLLALVLGVAACGGDSGTVSGSSKSANSTDVAFIDGMVPHHQSAIDMAKVAQQRGRSGYVKSLADDIVRTQSSEISTMRGIEQTLSGVKKGSLGLGMSAMGMSMDASMLKTARPFDRAFVDMMVPHHQGAIRMARVELAKGKSSQLRGIAKDVVAAQTHEINSMNDFRQQKYGAPSPAGGVPKDTNASGAMDGMSGMEHSG